MRAAGFIPHLVVYNKFIGAGAKAKDFAAVVQVYAYMKADGVPPTVRTFKRLVVASSCAEDLGKTLEFFVEMKAAGVRPTMDTFSVLMEACARDGTPDGVSAIFEAAVDHGFYKDAVTSRAYGNFDIISARSPTQVSNLHTTLHAVYCDLLDAHACRVLSGACNPMLCPFLFLFSRLKAWRPHGAECHLPRRLQPASGAGSGSGQAGQPDPAGSQTWPPYHHPKEARRPRRPVGAGGGGRAARGRTLHRARCQEQHRALHGCVLRHQRSPPQCLACLAAIKKSTRLRADQVLLLLFLFTRRGGGVGSRAREPDKIRSPMSLEMLYVFVSRL